MNKSFLLFALFLLFLGQNYCLSADNKTFFDSKSQIIGISGNYEALEKAGFKNKIFRNPIDISVTLPKKFSSSFTKEEINNITQQLVNQKAGKKVLDFLFQAINGHPSEKLLNERAIINAQNADKEKADVAFLSSENVIKDDYLPILENNFIYFETRGYNRRFFILYKVKIDKEVLNEVYTYWDNPNLYNQIEVEVKLVDYGVIETAYDSSLLERLNKTFNKIAIRGQLISRNPAKAKFPNYGDVEVNDRVGIYRQYINKKGEMASKKVSRAIVCDTEWDIARLIFFDRIKGSYKDGDWVVKEPHRFLCDMGLYFNTNLGADKCYGMSLMIGWDQFAKKYGIIRPLTRLKLDTNEKQFDIWRGDVGEIKEKSYYWAINADGGVGFSLHYLGTFEIMPYLMLCLDGVIVKDVQKQLEDQIIRKYLASAIGFSSGIRCDINIYYPIMLSIGAEYSYFIGLTQDANNSDSKGWLDRNYKDLVGEYKLNRAGFGLYAGINGLILC